MIRKNTKNRKIFLSDQSALKVLYLLIEAVSETDTQLEECNNRFKIEFPDKVHDPY